MSKLGLEIQKANPDAIVIMYDLDLRALGGNVFRFTAELAARRNILLQSGESLLLEDGVTELEQENADTPPVKWRGEDYLPMPVRAEGFELSSSGQFPRPKLTVANVLGTIKAEMIQYNDLIGATVTRWRTFAKHLDEGSDPDPDIYFPPDIYRIDRKSTETPILIEFELATVLDQQGVMLPRRQILRNTCTHVYRIYDAEAEAFDYTRATCPYGGTDFFDENGNSVSLPEQDIPSKMLDSCCKKRFPGQALPTRAFPGVGRFR